MVKKDNMKAADGDFDPSVIPGHSHSKSPAVLLNRAKPIIAREEERSLVDRDRSPRFKGREGFQNTDKGSFCPQDCGPNGGSGKLKTQKQGQKSILRASGGSFSLAIH